MKESVMNLIHSVGTFDKVHYLELVADGDTLTAIDSVECICSKTYMRGICFISYYFEGAFYAILQDASDDVPLLDVVFPNIAGQGNGLTLQIYDEGGKENKDSISWRKLSIWELTGEEEELLEEEIEATYSLSSPSYIQSYAVLKPNKSNASKRDVLFRFGSWCYSGEAELIPSLSISDIQYVIPALRTQQHNLAFLCQSSGMPTENIFTEPLAYVSGISRFMEQEILKSSEAIRTLQHEFHLDSEEDPNELFFQFESSSLRASKTRSILEKIDCIATKCYRPNGVIVMNVYFRGVFYACINSPNHENDCDQPLLDSTFPSVVQGKGYQLRVYPTGIDGWPELRKLSLWKNYEALEDELMTERRSISPCPHDVSNNHNSSVHSDHLAEVDTTVDPGKKQHYNHHQHLNPNPDNDSRKSRQNWRGMKFSECKDGDRDESISGCNSKNVNPSTSRNRNPSRKQNLGGVHHLAPLKKSKLETQLQSSTIQNKQRKINAPWSRDGRPKLR